MAHAPALEFRRPVTTWNISSVFLALCLHGILWFGVHLLIEQDQALSEAQRQMTFALAWMIGTLAMWRIRPPASRLHATGMLMLGALFVTLLGNVAALIAYVARGEADGENFLSAFLIFRGIKAGVELILAVPAALVLQALALRRSPAA